MALSKEQREQRIKEIHANVRVQNYGKAGKGSVNATQRNYKYRGTSATINIRNNKAKGFAGYQYKQQQRADKISNENNKQIIRQEHTILNRVILGGSISALFLLIFLLVTPMLIKWEPIWGNRNPANSNDVKSFYYNDSYTIQLADGTTKIIEYYNPEANEESPFIDEVENYTQLRDVYTYSDNEVSLQSVEDFLTGLNTVMDVGRKVYNSIASAVDGSVKIFDTSQGYLRQLWGWIKQPFTND